MSQLLEPPAIGALYLARAVWHDLHKEGFISFEELDTANTARILQATFLHTTITGCVGVLAEHGVSLRGARLYRGAEATPETLMGHSGAKGLGLCEFAIRRDLAQEAQVAA